MDDLRAVMDAAGSKRASQLRIFGGEATSVPCSRPPIRNVPARIVLFGTFARRTWSPDYPWRQRLSSERMQFEVSSRRELGTRA
jgi:hypothetical protein